MRTTIDGAGRLVIPKSVREQAGLGAGGEVEIHYRDGRIEIVAPAAEVRLVEGELGPVIEAAGDVPALTGADVRDVLERVRR